MYLLNILTIIQTINLIICYFEGNEYKSLRPSIQVDLPNSKNKETINKENEFLKQRVEELHEETINLKKNVKHIKSQVNIT